MIDSDSPFRNKISACADAEVVQRDTNSSSESFSKGITVLAETPVKNNRKRKDSDYGKWIGSNETGQNAGDLKNVQEDFSAKIHFYDVLVIVMASIAKEDKCSNELWMLMKTVSDVNETNSKYD